MNVLVTSNEHALQQVGLLGRCQPTLLDKRLRYLIVVITAEVALFLKICEREQLCSTHHSPSTLQQQGKEYFDTTLRPILLVSIDGVDGRQGILICSFQSNN
jgi:hypothetical protein